MLTFEEIRKNPEIKTYIERSNEVLGAVGFTEHGFPHALRTSDIASRILRELGYDARTCELAQIAGYMHDIGNLVNRHYHAQNGACLAFQILSRLGFSPDETAQIVSAIGHHDEKTAAAVSPIAAALILADKSDVRRSRVRNQETVSSDIHDRVNYAVEYSNLHFSEDKKSLVLDLTIDTEISSVLEYFEIFMERMLLSKRAALFFDKKFKMYINGSSIL